MSSFVIFDPKNNLIFSKCDEEFCRAMSELNMDGSIHLVDDENERQEIIHNWLSIYLTPCVSTFRELPENRLEFNLMPSTSIVYKDVNFNLIEIN